MPVDRTREFNLPGIHDLSKDQDEALHLPLEGQHLIIGGPGTGKSVVVLLRAKRLEREGKKYIVLVYNHLLNHSNHQFSGDSDEQMLSAQTWESWFSKIYRDTFRQRVPRKPESRNGYQPLDWPAIERKAQDLFSEDIKDQSDIFLVIDEGQDMPPAFYQTLISLGFKNFYVAADQNQQIHPDKCSSRQDIENKLCIKPDEALELKTNYRNTRPIAQLARHFYPEDPASPRPELPDQTPVAATPELWVYGTTDAELEKTACNILKLSDRRPRKLIGIIAPNNEVRKKFKKVLRNANPKLDNDKPPIQTFKSGQKQELPDFDQGGIMVINAQSCKGLEFDIAILADIDEHQPKHDPRALTLKARFYVMVARAREQAMLLRTDTICHVVDGLLPTDSSILARK